MIVLGEAPEMPGQLLDPLRQERDLDFRRSGVTFLGGKPGDDLLLLFPRERHSFLRTRRDYVMSSIYDRRMLPAEARSGKRRAPGEPVRLCRRAGKALLSSDDDPAARRPAPRSHRPRHRATVAAGAHQCPCRRDGGGARPARDPGNGPGAPVGLESWRRGRGPVRRLPGGRGARAGRDRGTRADVRGGHQRTAGCADHRAGDGRSLGPAWPAGAARRHASRCRPGGR